MLEFVRSLTLLLPIPAYLFCLFESYTVTCEITWKTYGPAPLSMEKTRDGLNLVGVRSESRFEGILNRIVRMHSNDATTKLMGHEKNFVQGKI